LEAKKWDGWIGVVDMDEFAVLQDHSVSIGQMVSWVESSGVRSLWLQWRFFGDGGCDSIQEGSSVTESLQCRTPILGDSLRGEGALTALTQVWAYTVPSAHTLYTLLIHCTLYSCTVLQVPRAWASCAGLPDVLGGKALTKGVCSHSLYYCTLTRCTAVRTHCTTVLSLYYCTLTHCTTVLSLAVLLYALTVLLY
jgi:hypothetical protein